MAERTTPSGNVLTSDREPPRPRAVVLADLIADRIFVLTPTWSNAKAETRARVHDELAAAIQQMLVEGTLKAQLEGE